MKTYKGKLYSLPENSIFVFGSNTEGKHGKGAAKIAKDKFGAIYGISYGLQGNSFGIVTKDLNKNNHPSISRLKIINQILSFYLFAQQNKNKNFYIAYTADNKNLNGYTSIEMANMFALKVKIPDNIIFEENFYKLMRNKKYNQYEK